MVELHVYFFIISCVHCLMPDKTHIFPFQHITYRRAHILYICIYLQPWWQIIPKHFPPHISSKHTDPNGSRKWHQSRCLGLNIGMRLLWTKSRKLVYLMPPVLIVQQRSTIRVCVYSCSHEWQFCIIQRNKMNLRYTKVSFSKVQ